MIAKSWQDLNGEIQIYVLRIQQLKRERRKLCGLAFSGPTGYKSDSSIEPTGVRGTNEFMPFNKAIERIEKTEELIAECTSMLVMLQKQLGQINTMLYSLEGRQYKIFYLHKCENKSFTEIAQELRISTKQAQRIYKEVVGDE